MASPEIYKQLTEIFRDLFDDDLIVLTPQTTAGDIDGWDSMMHVNVVLAVEMRFKIKFKTSEVESLHNVGHLADLVETKLVGERSPAHV
jgi:acyl carrier protein